MQGQNQPEAAVQPTIVMKDHAFDRDLDDLGMSPEDLEREVDADAPPRAREELVVASPQELMVRH